MDGILENIQFGILSSTEILNQSVCEITNTKLNGPCSIYDERMGVLENGKTCVTCNKNNKECIGHFGHIKLNVSISHPLFYKSIMNILKCICYQCSKLLMTKDQLEFHGFMKYNKQTRFVKILKVLEKQDVCLLCQTLQPKYMFSVNDKTISMVFKVNGEIRKNVLFDDEIQKIFENLTDDDVTLLGFDVEHSHPKNLIINVLPVLPPVARPYIISESVTCDDDLTIQYLEIVKANHHLVVDSSAINEIKRLRYTQSLKFRIKCLFDNSQERSKHSNGRPLKGIKKRLTGKEGQLRNNLMGKRVDKSARTVIGPDPTLKVNEIAIPPEIADILTYPIIVTNLNIKVLTDMLYSRKINYVIRKNTNMRINMKYALFKQDQKLYFGDYLKKKNGDLEFIKNEKQFFLFEDGDVVIRNGKPLTNFKSPIPKKFDLEVGDTVERKLQDDDIVLLNRQPTLHKGSMMAFNVKIRKGLTIRTNLSITKSFNADYDGDEMNIHAPNSVETEAELRLLSSVENHLISNQSNKPNIVIVQDGLLGAYLMSSYDDEIPYYMFLRIVESIGTHGIQKFQNKKDLFTQKCPHLPLYSGKMLFSCLLPHNMFYKHGDVLIEEGIMITGTITKTQLGSSHHSLIILFNNIYGSKRCEQFINEVQFIAYQFLLFHGFSIGIQDCIIPEEPREKIENCINKSFIETGLYYDSIRTSNILEMSVLNNLNNIRNSCMKIAKDHLPKNNKFLSTVLSGSKGDFFNITQIMALLGQQNFQGQRIQPTISDNQRTLPHFPFNPKDPVIKFESQGFIKNSFLKGLNPKEFWFHSITGREGITDTAMKSVTWETTIIIIDNGKPIYIEIGKWIDELLQINSDQIQHHKEKQMELLNISSDIYIPTTDYDGNVSWGKISAITRHDPGNKLYEIKTKSGRQVIVTESKSLLIWNSEINQFKELLTPDIKIGDFVPVTCELSETPIIMKNVDLTTYLPKTDYIYGTDYNIAIEKVNDIMINCKKIPSGWWSQNNGNVFTLPYKNKALFQRSLVRSNYKNIKNNCIYPYHSRRSDSKISDNFELNYENGIFIGLFLAEGSFSGRGVRITNNNKNIQDFVKNWFNKHSIQWDQEDKINHIGGRSFSIRGFSSVLSQFLRMFVGEGSSNKHVPNEAFISPIPFVLGLLNGYFSGDGCITKNSIDASSASKSLIEGISMLCSRLGIFCKLYTIQRKTNNLGTKNIKPSYCIRISAQWANKFSQQITLLEDTRNSKMKQKDWCKSHMNFKTHSNVVLDEIIEINLVDISKHPKVYDLTIPSTFNFGLANGLQVRDTATSGYIQRRMVKVAEDVQVKYDGTVRNSANSILQFRYGYNNLDPSQSVIIKNKENEPITFFADVSTCVQQLNYEFEKTTLKI